jgi:hypothetical protein
LDGGRQIDTTQPIRSNGGDSRGFSMDGRRQLGAPHPISSGGWCKSGEAVSPTIPNEVTTSFPVAAFLFYLADLIERTTRAVANWVTHQPRLWPGSRTMQQLCLVHSDTVQVDDALTRAVGKFARVASHMSSGDNAGVDGCTVEDAGWDGCSGSGAAAAGARVVAARASVRLALGHLTDAMVGTLTAVCGEMWDTAPKGCWAGIGGGNAGENPKP